MNTGSLASWLLANEARALLTRLARVKPFVLLEPMLPAAAISPSAQTRIQNFLASGRQELRGRVHDYINWLQGPESNGVSPAEAQRKFTILRLRFNLVLSQFDLFADVLTQRSEHETGVWLSGLDVVAADALALPNGYYEAPPVICYLDRGPGAAIRRARTRLPGGGDNPVAIIRVPRERMIGTGIASSLIHEVGHQGSVLLNLVESLRPILKGMQKGDGDRKVAWRFWERWISEILADFWSVARLGIGSTLGLLAVVSLPRPFMFRFNVDDPHPTPWIRVKLSCAIGNALYPHAQWGKLAKLWESLYPLTDLQSDQRQLINILESEMASFVSVLVNHRPRSLRGNTLGEVMSVDERRPDRLAAQFSAWNGSVRKMRTAPPSLVFAAMGQARADGKLTPEKEGKMLGYLLTYWALNSSLNAGNLKEPACGCKTARPVY